MKLIRFMIIAILVATCASAARDEYRILKFWSESDNYLSFEPAVLHAFVLDQWGESAKPLEGLSIRVRLDGDDSSTRSIDGIFEAAKNHYLFKLGVLKPGQYRATLFVQRESFVKTEEISFKSTASKDVRQIALEEIITISKGARVSLNDELLIWVRAIGAENATITLTDTNGTDRTGDVQEGGFGIAMGKSIEILKVSSEGVKFRLMIAKDTPKNNGVAVELADIGDLQEKVELPCDGCKSADGNCRLVGGHYVNGLDAVYCGEDKMPHSIQTYKKPCTEDYECVDFSCIDGLCKPEVETSWWERFVAWINSFFTGS